MEAEASLGGVGFSSLLVVPAWHLRVYGDLLAYPLLLGLLRGAGGNVAHEAVASVLFLPLALIAPFPQFWVAPAAQL